MNSPSPEGEDDVDVCISLNNPEAVTATQVCVFVLRSLLNMGMCYELCAQSVNTNGGELYKNLKADYQAPLCSRIHNPVYYL